jgi:hypothetical protein
MVKKLMVLWGGKEKALGAVREASFSVQEKEDSGTFNNSEGTDPHKRLIAIPQET